MDGHDFKKKCSEAFSVSTFGIAPAPHESLPLNMNQTALNQDSWPQYAQDPHQMGIAVYRSTVSNQATLFEMRTKGVEVAGSFGHLSGPVDNRAALGLHGGKDPFALVEEGSVQKKMAMSCQFDCASWRTFEPMLDDASYRADAVTALSCELSHGVALNNPALEPDPLTQSFVESVFPNESPTAHTTTKALLALRAFSMLPNLCTGTMRTMFFCSSKHHHC